MKKSTGLGLILLFVAGGITGLFSGLYYIDNKKPNFSEEYVLYVRPDTGVDEIVDSLIQGAGALRPRSVERTFRKEEVDGNIKPGRYGASVISNVDSKEGIITFVGEYGKKGESFKIPPKANKLWAFLKLLIETESEDGSTTITNDFKTWNGLFDRKETKFGGQETKRRKEELQKLKRHIKSCKGPGRRGLPMLKIVAKVSRSRAKKTD